MRKTSTTTESKTKRPIPQTSQSKSKNKKDDSPSMSVADALNKRSLEMRRRIEDIQDKKRLRKETLIDYEFDD